MLDSITSGLVGVSSRNFIQPTSREEGVIKWAQFLQCPTQKFVTAKKIVQIFSRFLTTYDFDREYLRKGSTYQKLEKLLIIYNPSHVRPKNLAYFGPQTKKLLTLINLHPNRLFSRDYISALRGCCALEFLPCDAMRCTVLVIVILFVCLSDRPSITLVDCVHMVRPTIMISSPMVAPSF